MPRSFVLGLGPRVYARGTLDGLPLEPGDVLCLRFFEGPVGDQHEGWVERFGKRLGERP